MSKYKHIIALTATSILVTTPVNAINKRYVIDTTEQGKINELKSNIYQLFNTRYTKNVAMLNKSENSEKVAYTIKIASNLEDLEKATPLTSYANFEKSFDKLYSSLNYNQKIVIRYSTLSTKLKDSTIVDYKQQTYKGNESNIAWSTLEDGEKIGKLPLSPDPITQDPRFITVKVGDIKLDTSRPIFRQENGYYIGEDGYSIKKVNELEIETKETLPDGIIDGYYEDASLPLSDDDKIEKTDAIVKRADEFNTSTFNVSDLYEKRYGRLTFDGNELLNYAKACSEKENYNVKFNGINKTTGIANSMYVDDSDKQNIVVRYIDNNELVNASDLCQINIEVEQKTTDNKYIINEYSIKPTKDAGLDNILNSMTDNISTLTYAGIDRYLTSVQISRNGWKYGSENVVLVSGDDKHLVDGLTATPLAASLNVPILLTKKDAVPSDVIDEIDRLNAKNVYIVGGENAISKEVSDKLYKYYGKNVKRIQGEDRYQTSIEVAKEVVKSSNGKVDTFVVGGNGIADALSISSVAGSKLSPIILIPKDNLSIDAKYFLSEHAKNTYVVGGKSQVSSDVLTNIVKLGLNVDRLYGDTRQDTNAAVINEFYSVDKELYNNGGIVIAKSNNLGLVDALGSGAFGSKIDAPVVLASDELSEEQKDVLNTVKNKEHKVQVGYGIESLVMDYFN